MSHILVMFIELHTFSQKYCKNKQIPYIRKQHAEDIGYIKHVNCV